MQIFQRLRLKNCQKLVSLRSLVCRVGDKIMQMIQMRRLIERGRWDDLTLLPKHCENGSGFGQHEAFTLLGQAAVKQLDANFHPLVVSGQRHSYFTRQTPHNSPGKVVWHQVRCWSVQSADSCWQEIVFISSLGWKSRPS